ncbi:MAG: non-ribosomal peptide synthetase [Candidatus Sericytochromatia bacterium]
MKIDKKRKKEQNYYKKVSNSERFYQVCEKISPPFSIQMMLEGSGELSLETLSEALKEVAKVNKGTRLALKRKGLKQFWFDTKIPPKVKIADEKFFKEFEENKVLIDSTKNPYFYSNLDLENGRSCEVYLSNGKTTRVIFRALHSLMDARGLLFWAEEVFRYLRKEPLLGTNTTISDIEHYKSFEQNSKVKKVPLGARSPSPLGKKQGNDLRPVWARKKIYGNFPTLVSQLIYLLAQESYKYSDKQPTFMISADMRNKDNKFQTTTNLSSPIYLMIKKESSYLDIYTEIINTFKDNRDKQVDKTEDMIHFMPVNFLANLLKNFLNGIYNKDSYLFSVAISNLGKIEPKSFSNINFECKNVLFLPVDIPGFSISLISVENPEYIELILSAPYFTANNGRFEKLMDSLEKGLIELNKVLASKNSLASEEEKKQIDIFNSTDTIYTKDKTVIDLFEEQVKLNPNDIAISMQEKKLTYLELNNKVNYFSHYLNTKVGKNTIIGLFANHSIETLISILAILKSKNAYLPIAPEQPDERVKFMLEDANVSCLLTNLETGKFFSEEKTIFLNEELFNKKWTSYGVLPPHEEGNLAPEHANLNPSYSKDNEDLNYLETISLNDNTNSLAYVMYTSGSTGKPKGVKITNQNLLNYILWVKKYGLLENEKTIYPFYTSLSFDLTITSIFLPLTTGNQIEVYKNEDHKFAIKKIVDDKKANIIKLTPTHLKVLKELDNNDFKIKKIITLGEALPTELARDIYNKFDKKVEIINQYGPTEATVGCMAHTFNPDKDFLASIPIGVPGDNTYIYILNEDKKEVSVGSIGEMYISGDCVAEGYLNREELNNKVFISDPFNKDFIMYKTGDLALRLPNYEIEYIGRKDEQVKLRGFRIELEEINTIINQIEGVKESIVLVKDNKDENLKYLIAYYISDSEINNKYFRDFLADKLPYYMIPLKYIKIDEIPLTVNGKVNKKALFSLESNEETFVNDEFEQQDLITQKVKKAISKVIDESENKIKDEDNLFDLGIDSLSMTLLFNKLTKELLDNNENYLIQNIDKILKNPTVKNLIHLIKKV